MNQSISQTKSESTVNSIIKYFPISFFAVILGLGGLTIALQKITQLSGLSIILSRCFLYLALLIFFLATLLYLFKIMRFPAEVKNELAHPNKMNFFPAFSISLLLFSAILVDINILSAKILWVAGVIMHLFFTLRILSFWLQHPKLETTHLNPVWFLPVVGNLIVPLAGASLFSKEISWFFFSIGMVFWLILFSVLFNRLLFYKPLSEKLLPTFFILLAPPAIGFIAYVKLSGMMNDFSRILYYFALFMFILLVIQVKYIYRSKFYLSRWAYSFPIAAITIATALMYKQTGMAFFKGLAYLLFAILIIVVVGLCVRTVQAMIHKQVFVKED